MVHMVSHPPQAHLSSERIQSTMYGFAKSQLVFTAVELDVFTAIEEGHHTVEKLAQQKRLNPRALRIFLDGLVGIGFLLKDAQGQYTLPEDVACYLSKSSPNFLGGMVTHCKGLSEIWPHLGDVVRSGVPAGGAQGLTEIEAFFAELVKGLYVSNYPVATRLAQRLKGELRVPSPFHVLDVAGGSGVWSIALLEQFTDALATIVDYPTVIEVSKRYVANHGLADRYTYLGGDLEWLSLPVERYDVAIVANICHAIGPDQSQQLFDNIFNTLKPGGTLLIVDFIPDNDRAKEGWPLLFGVNMLVLTTDGNVYTEGEYQTWLSHSGFGQIHRFDIQPDEVTVLQVHKPTA